MALDTVTKTYSLGVGNTTASEAAITPIALGLVTNYAKSKDEPTVAQIKNRTSGLDQQEMISYKCRRLKKVDVEIPVYNPAKVPDGVLYSINLQNILRETWSDGTVIDHPIEMWVTIKHDISDVWTSVPSQGNSYVYSELKRLIGACFTDDGSERFDALAKSALVPTED